MASVHATDKDFDKKVLQHKGFVVVDFWAEWCGPCRIIGPVLEELSNEYQEKLKVVKLNVDENQKIAQDYDVRSIPTLIFFKDGKPVDMVIGAYPKPALKDMIEKMLK